MLRMKKKRKRKKKENYLHNVIHSGFETKPQICLIRAIQPHMAFELAYVWISN